MAVAQSHFLSLSGSLQDKKLCPSPHLIRSYSVSGIFHTLAPRLWPMLDQSLCLVTLNLRGFPSPLFNLFACLDPAVHHYSFFFSFPVCLYYQKASFISSLSSSLPPLLVVAFFLSKSNAFPFLIRSPFLPRRSVLTPGALGVPRSSLFCLSS